MRSRPKQMNFLLIIILLSPFIYLVATGQTRLGGGTTLLNSYSFDSTSSITSFAGAACPGLPSGMPSTSGYAYPAVPQWCNGSWGAGPLISQATPPAGKTGTCTYGGTYPNCNPPPAGSSGTQTPGCGSACGSGSRRGSIFGGSLFGGGALLGGGAQTFSMPLGTIQSANLASQSYGCYYVLTCNGYGWATASYSPTLTGAMSASNWQLLGSTANQNFLNTWPEPVPTNATGPCPNTQVTGGCNPFTLNLKQSSGNMTSYNLYRFTFVVSLSIAGEKIIANTYCSPDVDSNGGICTGVEINSLNSALSYVNLNDKITGTILVDFSIPDPFRITSPQDAYGIIGAWTAKNGCLITSSSPQQYGGANPLQNGGLGQVSPCSPALSITDNLLPPGISVNPTTPLLSSYSATNNPITSNMNPNGQFVFNINALQEAYKAVICNPANQQTGVNCPASSTTDCLTNNGCSIQWDAGTTIQIPLVVDVIGTSPSLQLQAQNVAIITNTGTGNYQQLTGNIQVHVQDSIFGLPVSGMGVNYGLGGSCSTANPVKNTDQNGNALIAGIQSGTYTVCSTGNTGQLVLFFFALQVQYTQGQQGGLSVVPGLTTQATIILQPNLMGWLTSTSIILIAVGIIAIILLIAVAPGSLVTLGIGSARALRTYRGRQRK